MPRTVYGRTRMHLMVPAVRYLHVQRTAQSTALGRRIQEPAALRGPLVLPSTSLTPLARRQLPPSHPPNSFPSLLCFGSIRGWPIHPSIHPTIHPSNRNFKKAYGTFIYRMKETKKQKKRKAHCADEQSSKSPRPANAVHTHGFTPQLHLQQLRRRLQSVSRVRSHWAGLFYQRLPFTETGVASSPCNTSFVRGGAGHAL